MAAKPDVNTLCALLQDNDPNTTKVEAYNGHSIPVDYDRIGKALQGNTHVTDLTVEMRFLFDSSPDYDESSFASNHERANENELFIRGEKNADLLLQYIRSSTTLRELSLRDFDSLQGMEHRVASRLAGLFFRAVASSSSIVKLDIGSRSYVEISQESFGVMLQQTRSLRRLHIPAPNTTMHFEWIGGAFRTNSTLESLVLESDGSEESEESDDYMVTKDILSSLHSLPKMQDLCLRYHGEITNEAAEGLCSFLGATSTLRRLDIDYSYMTAEAMQRLIDGLRSNRGTVKRLGLPFDNILPPDTSQALMTYLRSTAGPSNCLSDLRYYDTELDALAESMLIPDSIGSGLRHLELGFADVDVFLNALSTHGSHSKLESLQIVFYDTMADALWRCIPTLVHLRELRVHLTWLNFNSIFPRLVPSLKKNGSLFKVTFPMNYGDPEPDPPGCRKRRYLDALGQRNENLPRMLSRPRLEHEAQQEDIANDDMTDIEQFPSLFAASLDAEQMSPNTFLIGLVSSQGEVGQHSHGEKRTSRAIY
jgi:hypothetical protein